MWLRFVIVRSTKQKNQKVNFTDELVAMDLSTVIEASTFHGLEAQGSIAEGSSKEGVLQGIISPSRLFSFSGSNLHVFLRCGWFATHFPRLAPSSEWLGGTLHCPSRFWNCFSRAYISSRVAEVVHSKLISFSRRFRLFGSSSFYLLSCVAVTDWLTDSSSVLWFHSWLRNRRLLVGHPL
jgi:hypothetical protein